jgi:phosphatidylglycerophosphate synthase
LYPDSWTPNTVTFIGQIPQVAVLLLTFAVSGMSLSTADPPAKNFLFVLMGLSLNWFSQHDVMDGLRARRQKTGTAFGRIFDEALDMIQQTCYSMWLGYLCRFDNYILEQIFLMSNVVFHSMEMKYLMCRGQLQMTVGEVGPLELEAFLALLFIITGGVIGPECMQLNLGDCFGVTNTTLAAVQLKHITGCIFLPLLFGFLYDHLGDCIKASSKSALFYMTPVLVNMFLGFLLSFSLAYKNERAIFYVFINMCNANVTL